jgi:1,5-anhydro-D-fructose reductase (1,5-anhydro-D-mannitol-forming)
VRGTTGSLLFGFGRDELIGKGGELGDDWAPVALGEPAQALFDLWVEAMRGAADPADNVRAAIELTRFVVAANTAAATGAAVELEPEGRS